MAEKKIVVKELKVGSIISEEVYADSGKVLLGKNTVLTARHILLLDNWDIKSVYIHGKEQASTPMLEQIPLAHSAEYKHFIQEYDAIIANTAQSFDIIRKRKIIPVSYLEQTAGHVCSAIFNNKIEIMNYLLISDHKTSDFVSRHSVMVAYFAGVIARQMNWSDSDIAGVTLAGLLHDVGSLANDRTEGSQNQVNFIEAWGLLRETKGLSNEVLLGIMQHRERSNGSGFPSGTAGGKIHPYAKIIAVADLFHNLAYGDEHTNPFPILDVLAREMYGTLDTDVCQNLIERVRDSLLFNKVLLSSGEEAEVIFFNRGNYCLPIVRTEDSKIINLSGRDDITIRRLSTCFR